MKKGLKQPPQKKEGGRLNFRLYTKGINPMSFYDLMFALIVLAILFFIIR
jgi:hypothetical protein